MTIKKKDIPKWLSVHVGLFVYIPSFHTKRRPSIIKGIIMCKCKNYY